MCVCVLSHVPLFVTPWTAASQAPPSIGFSRQEYWSGVPLPKRQIKTVLRYHLTPVKMAVIKKSTNTHAGEALAQREASSTIGGNEKWRSHRGKQYGGSSRNQIESPYDPAIPPLSIYPDKTTAKKTHAPLASLFAIAKT